MDLLNFCGTLFIFFPYRMHAHVHCSQKTLHLINHDKVRTSNPQTNLTIPFPAYFYLCFRQNTNSKFCFNEIRNVPRLQQMAKNITKHRLASMTPSLTHSLPCKHLSSTIRVWTDIVRLKLVKQYWTYLKEIFNIC